MSSGERHRCATVVPPGPGGFGFALLFELENATAHGRQVIFGILRDVLAQREIALAPWVFSRYCLSGTPEQYLPRVLDAVGARRAPVQRIVAEVKAGISTSLLRPDTAIDPVLANALTVAGEMGMGIGGLTCLDNGCMNDLTLKLGLKDARFSMLMSSACAGQTPTEECWTKLAGMVGVPPSGCVVMATRAVACRSALKAGMRCVGVPDEFTASEDFSGADSVVSGGGTSTGFRDLLLRMR